MAIPMGYASRERGKLKQMSSLLAEERVALKYYSFWKQVLMFLFVLML